MNTHDIELPPLPDAEAYLYICGEHRGVSLNYRGDADLSEGTRRNALITIEQANARVRAAIEAVLQSPEVQAWKRILSEGYKPRNGD